MSFEQFYNQLFQKVLKTKTLYIFGEEKIISGMATYRTIHNLEYTKIVFDDKSFLYIVPEDEEIYYSETYTIQIDIQDNEIGNLEEVEYNKKIYKLDNKNDYQYVIHFRIGDISNIEGECRFSDYIPNEGDDFLSLAIISYTGKRADINPSLISLDDISF